MILVVGMKLQMEGNPPLSRLGRQWRKLYSLVLFLISFTTISWFLHFCISLLYIRLQAFSNFFTLLKEKELVAVYLCFTEIKKLSILDKWFIEFCIYLGFDSLSQYIPLFSSHFSFSRNFFDIITYQWLLFLVIVFTDLTVLLCSNQKFMTVK